MLLFFLIAFLFLSYLLFFRCQEQQLQEEEEDIVLTYQFDEIISPTNNIETVQLILYKSDNITEKLNEICIKYTLTDCEQLHTSIQQKLVKVNLINHSTTTNYPIKINTIWILWYQGWNDAPPIVKKCLQSWQYHHSPYDYNIILLDKHNIHQFIDISDVIPSKIIRDEVSIIVLSDIIRWLLLDKYGGIWVDSTLYSHRPLSAWIDLTYDPHSSYDTPSSSSHDTTERSLVDVHTHDDNTTSSTTTATTTGTNIYIATTATDTTAASTTADTTSTAATASIQEGADIATVQSTYSLCFEGTCHIFPYPTTLTNTTSNTTTGNTSDSSNISIHTNFTVTGFYSLYNPRILDASYRYHTTTTNNNNNNNYNKYTNNSNDRDKDIHFLYTCFFIISTKHNYIATRMVDALKKYWYRRPTGNIL